MQARWHAFPGAGLRREILEPLTNLHLWRNRIAHHDSLLCRIYVGDGAAGRSSPRIVAAPICTLWG